VSAPDPVDIAAANLGLVRGQHTDPELLERVLRDDLLLGDFEPFTERVAPLLASPQPLDPMLERIQDAIRHRQPAVLAFLEAHASDLSVPDEAAQVVTRMVHHTYLLEELAQAIVASPSFLEALHAHVHALREIFGLRERFFAFVADVYRAADGGVFEAAKIRTLDLMIDQYMGWRKGPEGELNEAQRFRKNAGIKLNMFEAVTKDLFAGFADNARVGTKLGLVGVRELRVCGPNKVVQQVLAPGWTSLYQAWNLAFMMGNLDNLDLLYPKLLVPSVIDAADDDYLFRRGCVLWFSANITLFNILRARHDGEERVPRMPELARAWGAINLAQSEGLLAGHLGKD